MKGDEMRNADLKKFLDEKVLEYNNPSFIELDPVSIPHLFLCKENIEIAGFLSASIAWGQRKTIISNMHNLIRIMQNDPYEFVLNADKRDFKQLNEFKHRTFNGIDCQFFIQSLRNIYLNHGGLERVFTVGYEKNKSIADALRFFRQVFLSIDHPHRSQKHIADISRGSAAKRLNMFLRWMIRNDDEGVDFGLWNIPASALMLPLDVHSGRMARKFELLERKQNDWTAVEEVTAQLRNFDPDDPVKYDFALFGLGVFEKF